MDVLPYGGDDGIISLLPRGEKGWPTIVALRRYDDEVRALAVSPDGLRVAVGFDDGSTKVYSYDGWSSRRVPPSPPPLEEEEGGAVIRLRSRRNRRRRPAGLFLTQGDDDYDGDDGNAGGAKVYDGARMDAPVRQVASIRIPAHR